MPDDGETASAAVTNGRGDDADSHRPQGPQHGGDDQRQQGEEMPVVGDGPVSQPHRRCQHPGRLPQQQAQDDTCRSIGGAPEEAQTPTDGEQDDQAGHDADEGDHRSDAASHQWYPAAVQVGGRPETLETLRKPGTSGRRKELPNQTAASPTTATMAAERRPAALRGRGGDDHGSRPSAANPSGRVKNPIKMASTKKILRICSKTPAMPASDHTAQVAVLACDGRRLVHEVEPHVVGQRGQRRHRDHLQPEPTSDGRSRPNRPLATR